MRAFLLLVGALLLAGCSARGRPPDAGGADTVARPDAAATVGPLFRHGLSSAHSCTASVVDSPHGDLILTAAHCLSGTAQGWQFAPGYQDGRTPFGVWTVQSAYVDPAWIARQDDADDYAILQVAGQQRSGHTLNVQELTGANRLGSAPTTGEQVIAVGYNAGLDDRPVRCLTTVYLTANQPTFDCHGYAAGSSGSPWLAADPQSPTSVVVAVIGGLRQGGCSEYTSYSSPFRPDIDALLTRAEQGLHPDTIPAARSDGC